MPVIQDADKLSLDQISIKIKELAEKARNKKLLNTDLANRTISISSLGKLGGIIHSYNQSTRCSYHLYVKDIQKTCFGRRIGYSANSYVL